MGLSFIIAKRATEHHSLTRSSSESEPEPESRMRPWARRLAIRLARGSGESAEDCDDDTS